ncbi:MAG: aminotransferase class I/II-fold pyridoxal phosphate-dependent enzyme [Phycisphaerae bacterium]|nr:aminotransferase class I/II-fold pyridoxal phosphate-dependent enzyme [Phycisphaerae bacterium]
MLSKRVSNLDASGIRKVFDLAGKLTNPVNLSIGQPDFAVPRAVQDRAIKAIKEGQNRYTVTQGIGQLRQAIGQCLDEEFGAAERNVLVTSGVSGGLVLAFLCLLDPGDEVIIPDPYFVMYKSLIELVGARAVLVDAYPNFGLHVEKISKAISERTRAIVVNSPSNPTGAVYGRADLEGLAELARQKELIVISDEIYNEFCYDEPYVSMAGMYERTLLLRGFSKTYGMTGWRLGYASGPAELIEKMAMVQQYTFVCAPNMVQWAGITALETDMSEQVESYRRKRDLVYEGLSRAFEVVKPGGAFYIFPRAPQDDSEEFVRKALEQNVLIIPGNVFSSRNSHFRVSYAASEELLSRGVEILCQLAG